jgi:FixJ family two-component response regulator
MISLIISVVDDDAVVREGIADLLNALGYTALAFGSAELFLDSNQVKNTGCLITDQQLPGLSGTELQAQLRTDGYHTPIIFMTAFPEDWVRNRALGAGAVAFLTKPFKEADLLQSVETALSGGHVRDRPAEGSWGPPPQRRASSG